MQILPRKVPAEGAASAKALRQARLAFPKLSKVPKWLGKCVEGRTVVRAIGALTAWLMQVEDFALHSDCDGRTGRLQEAMCCGLC